MSPTSAFLFSSSTFRPFLALVSRDSPALFSAAGLTLFRLVDDEEEKPAVRSHPAVMASHFAYIFMPPPLLFSSRPPFHGHAFITRSGKPDDGTTPSPTVISPPLPPFPPPFALTFSYKWILFFFPGDRNEPRPAYLVTEREKRGERASRELLCFHAIEACSSFYAYTYIYICIKKKYISINHLEIKERTKLFTNFSDHSITDFFPSDCEQ